MEDVNEEDSKGQQQSRGASALTSLVDDGSSMRVADAGLQPLQGSYAPVLTSVILPLDHHHFERQPSVR